MVLKLREGGGEVTISACQHYQDSSETHVHAKYAGYEGTHANTHGADGYLRYIQYTRT
jgi:hypothetical protein